ncbi:MAG: Sulfurtransferase [Gemmatimonadetes bacterium]|nr:Sulfurtransferase [Gemmatimonadota bacterium]
MPYTTLISTDDLAANAGTFVIVDCRFALDDVEWGRREYSSGHIPGAAYAHLDTDLSSSRSGTNGRHPLPDPSVLRDTFARLGISNGSQVVAYDQDNGMYASRLWWLLRWMGHDAVAVLDGGFAKWMAEGRPTSAGMERRERGQFTGAPRAEMLMSANDVSSVLGHDEWRLIDARAPERFRGDVEPLDRVAGHIPGAANHFFKQNLAADGTYKSPGQLHEALDAVIGSAEHVVCYCGSGVTACHNLLALEHAGLPGARLYAGSWSEWSSDPARPVETLSSAGR